MTKHASFILALTLASLLCLSNAKEGVWGGFEACPHQYPWMAELRNGPLSQREHACGGTLICSKYVLTALHCVKGLEDPRLLDIVLGQQNKTKNLQPGSLENGATKINISNITRYGAWGEGFDLAILELETPVQFTDSIKPVFLPEFDDEKKLSPKSKLVASGWGYNPDGPNDNLRVVALNYFPPSECSNELYPPLTMNATTELCAGVGEEADKDVCGGDSGGPLVWLDDNSSEVKVLGAVTWGEACGSYKNKVGVYANIANALEWIKEVTGSCNEVTCSQGHCMTKDKLKNQALALLTNNMDVQC